MNFKDLKQQFIRLIPVFLITYVPLFLFFCILLLVHFITNVGFTMFLDDPLSYLMAPSYIGLASNIGVLFWWASASILIFSYIVLRRKGITGPSVSFLLAFGLISVILAVDDLFMVHEAFGNLFESTFGTDNPGEGITFAVYILLFISFIVRYRKVILRTDYVLLLVFIVICVFNIAMDMGLIKLHSELNISAEEISKQFAIITWLAYTTRTAFKLVKDPASFTAKPVSTGDSPVEP